MSWVRGMWAKHRVFILDMAERVMWTALQAAAAIGAVVLADLPPAYVAVIAPALAAVKALAARKLGDKDSAATLPSTK
jgi:hypothetical protein